MKYSSYPAKRTGNAMDLAYTALGAVLIAVCSWITIPMAVPFTMQTFAVFLTLSLLGGRRGTAAIAAYVLLGAVGLPVFSGFSGGYGVLLGATGGYIAGFVFTGLVYWLVTALFGKKWWIEALALLAGLILVYAVGTAWYMAVYARGTGSAGLGAVLLACVAPFILPDLVKLGLALALARRLSPAFRYFGV